MNLSCLKRLAAALILLPTSASILADNYILVDKPAKVFDEPNARGYVTLNTHNKEVSPLPGMVFKSNGSSNGWYQVEYSPGLRGFLSDQWVSTSPKAPKPGTYKVSNQPGVSLQARQNADSWEAVVGAKTFPGKLIDGVVVFTTPDNQTAYSLADFGQGPVVMCYDNSVTGFF